MVKLEKGITYTDYFRLVEAVNPDAFLIDPVITAGDFLISIDGGAEVALANLPVVTPAGSWNVQYTLTAAETAGDVIAISGIDSLTVWQNIAITLYPPVASTNTMLERWNLNSEEDITINGDANSVESTNVHITRAEDGSGNSIITRTQ